MSSKKKLKDKQLIILNLVITGIVLSSLLLFVFFRKRRCQKQFEAHKEKLILEKALAEKKRKNLILQLNPHFIFTAFSSLENLINENNQKVAVKYLTKFSRLMRLILEYSPEPVISLEKEIELVNYYLELERFKYEDKFDYNIDSTGLCKESFYVPPMFILPCVEKAITQLNNNPISKGKIDISFYCAETDTHTENTAIQLSTEEIKNTHTTGMYTRIKLIVPVNYGSSVKNV